MRNPDKSVNALGRGVVATSQDNGAAMSDVETILVCERPTPPDPGTVCSDLLRSARLASQTGRLLYPRLVDLTGGDVDDLTRQRLLPYEPTRPARLGRLLERAIASYLPSVTVPSAMFTASRVADRALDSLLACLGYAVDHPAGPVDRPVVLLAGVITFMDLLAAANASWCDLETGWRPVTGGRTAAVEMITLTKVRDPQVRELIRRVEVQAWVRERLTSEEDMISLEDSVLVALGEALDGLESDVEHSRAGAPLALPASPPQRLHVGPHDWMTIEDYAARTQQHVEVVRRHARAGKIPGATKLPGGHWRIPASALDALRDSHEVRRRDQRRVEAAADCQRARAQAARAARRRRGS